MEQSILIKRCFLKIKLPINRKQIKSKIKKLRKWLRLLPLMKKKRMIKFYPKLTITIPIQQLYQAQAVLEVTLNLTILKVQCLCMWVKENKWTSLMILMKMKLRSLGLTRKGHNRYQMIQVGLRPKKIRRNLRNKTFSLLKIWWTQ